MLALESGAQQEAKIWGGAAENRWQHPGRLFLCFPALLQYGLQGHRHGGHSPDAPLPLLRLLGPRAGGAGRRNLGTREGALKETRHGTDTLIRLQISRTSLKGGLGTFIKLLSNFKMLIFELTIPFLEIL